MMSHTSNSSLLVRSNTLCRGLCFDARPNGLFVLAQNGPPGRAPRRPAGARPSTPRTSTNRVHRGGPFSTSRPRSFLASAEGFREAAFWARCLTPSWHRGGSFRYAPDARYRRVVQQTSVSDDSPFAEALFLTLRYRGIDLDTFVKARVAPTCIRCTDPVMVTTIRPPQVAGHDDRGEVDSTGEGVAGKRTVGHGVLRGQVVQGEHALALVVSVGTGQRRERRRGRRR